MLRSKSALGVLWLFGTVVAVAVVWQSLGFVQDRTADDDPVGGGSSALAAPPTSAAPTSLPPTSAPPTDADPTSTTDPGSTTPGTDSAVTSPTAAPGAIDQTFQLEGFSAAIRYAPDGEVTVLWSAPAPGFELHEIEPEHTGLKVEYRSSTHRSRLDVWWDNGPKSLASEEAD
jgi:hypothetical protein